MYGHPAHLLSEEEARSALEAFDRLALLVTHGEHGINATHLPIVVEHDRILGHIACANAQWRDAPCEALLILPGVETYVSPNWYETKKRTGRAVPTWNYQTLHVRGALTVFDDRDRLRTQLTALAAKHEAAQPTPWSLADAPDDYVSRLLDGIVGIEIAVGSVQGKRKLSQEKTADDFAGVAEALSRSDDPRDRAVAEAMRRARQDVRFRAPGEPSAAD
jgi:transcriptional regulator